jgi:hypothetical protein
MCDYSLHAVASRPAKVGDELVTTKFAGSMTRGFCAIGQPNEAVCLVPGTEIAFKKETHDYRNPIARLFSGFEREPEHRKSFARLFSGLRIARGKVARFRQINTHQAHTHHDALEFADGTIVLLTQLCTGERATVLQLPIQARPSREDAPKEQHSVIAS